MKLHIVRLVSVFICLLVFKANPIFGYSLNLKGEIAFGLKLSSTIDSYVKILGDPDGIIEMGKNRMGYIYGQKMVLIFWNNKLWQIEMWGEPPIEAFTYIQNINKNKPTNIQLDFGIKTGMTRKEFRNIVPSHFIADGDEFSDLLSFNKTTVFLKYVGKYPEQMLDYISITYEMNNPNRELTSP